ncbi:MAG: Ig-like domain-containing protein [Gemmatimonadaceae bacterium]
MRIRAFRGVALVVAPVLVLSACSDGPTGADTGVARVEVQPNSVQIPVGAATPLAATVLDADGNVIAGRTVVWSSENDNIASVSSAGVVTAKQVGTVQIAASAGGQSDVATVQITRVPVASVVVSPNRATVPFNQSLQLTATARDAAGNVLGDRQAAWSSSNEGVVSVSASGVVTARWWGSATITANVEGVAGSATIDVPVFNAPVARVEVSPSSATIEEDRTLQLSVMLFDERNNVLGGRSVSWSSSNTSICTVSSTGRVTAKKEGTCVVTATSEGKKGSSTIRVEDD